MNNRFSGILEFVMTVEHGSFTAAAEALGISGSAVGKSIAKLEERLGVQLFHRTTRRIFLTSEGEALLTSCRRIFEELTDIETLLSNEHKRPVGRLKIDLPTTFGRQYIFPKIVEIIHKYPELDISVTFQDRAVDMICEGVDLVIRMGRLADHSDLIARSLGRQKLLICAAPSYLARKGYPQTKEDLQRHDCLIGWRQSNKSNWLIHNARGEIEECRVSYKHEIPDGDALLQACIAGCGLAQFPSWLAYKELKAGTLISVMEDVTGVNIPIHLIWQKKYSLQPKIRTVVDELIAFAQSQPELFFNHYPHDYENG